MKNTNEIVQRIESHYVGDECIQLAIPYRNAITILDQDGILFHDKIGSNLYINKYLEDERRSQFPYSNIPIYYSKKMFKGKVGCLKILYTETFKMCFSKLHII